MLKILIAAVLLLALLAGCGSASAPVENRGGYTSAEAPMAAASKSYIATNGYADSSIGGSMYYDEADYGMYESEPVEQYSGGSGGGDQPAQADTYDKIIYSGSASVETIHFEETVEMVYRMIDRYHGFLESAYVTGKDYNTQYYNRASFRTADFVIRVPRESFSTMRTDLDTLGSVTYTSVEAQNITSSYMDVQSRLQTYRVEEERLLDMLKKADLVEDMLDIEDRLSNVRYQIESLTSTLTNWDSKINYSTLRLSVREVKELTEEKPIARTFGDDIREGIQSSLDWLVQAGKDIVVFLVSALPIIVIPVIVVVVLVLVVRSRLRKKKKIAALQETKDVKDDD
jgi:hypothetical protein